MFYQFILSPQKGQVYNVGGGRQNSISLLEAIDLIEEITGERIKYELATERTQIISGLFQIQIKLEMLFHHGE